MTRDEIIEALLALVGDIAVGRIDMVDVPVRLRKLSEETGFELALVPAAPKPKRYDEQVVRVFAYWKKATGHTRARMTPERVRAIRKRLEDGYTEREIIRAINGCIQSDFHRGDNEAGKRYDDITLICRNGTKLERFMQMAEDEPEVGNEEEQRLRHEMEQAKKRRDVDGYNQAAEQLRAYLRGAR